MKKGLKITLIVSIPVIIIIVLLIKNISNTVSESKRNQIKLDAMNFIRTANIQFLEDSMNNDSITSKCYKIDGMSGIYREDNNYIGSVYVTNKDAYIWLSDGTYHATGKMNDITVTKYSTPATQNCNR